MKEQEEKKSNQPAKEEIRFGMRAISTCYIAADCVTMWIVWRCCSCHLHKSVSCPRKKENSKLFFPFVTFRFGFDTLTLIILLRPGFYVYDYYYYHWYCIFSFIRTRNSLLDWYIIKITALYSILKWKDWKMQI